MRLHLLNKMKVQCVRILENTIFKLLWFFFSPQTFKPLVGKSVYSSVTAVEFLVDKQLDFVTEDSAFQPYQVRNIDIAMSNSC